MNRLIMSVALTVTMTCGLVLPREYASAEETKDLVGTWSLASSTVEQNGQLFSFATDRPIDDASTPEALGLLSLLANRTMVAGADPSASVSPDHALLVICDQVVMAKRQHDKIEAVGSQFHSYCRGPGSVARRLSARWPALLVWTFRRS